MAKKKNPILGSKGESTEQHTPVEAPNSLLSIAYARIVDLVSEGEIVGLVNGLKSIYLNETPIENSDGSKNFQNYTVDYRYGTQTQDYIPGFPGVENELLVGIELTQDTPYTRQFTDLDINALRVRLSTPGLYKVNIDNGDTNGYSVSYAIDLSLDGGAWTQVIASSFTGKTTTKYERSHRIELPRATNNWQIRVRRLTANSTSSSVADKTFVEAVTEIVDGKLRYPNSAIFGLTFDSSQFQNIPTRSYDLKGRIIRVPVNYDPVTREYTGTWNGTFKLAWTDNPAWCFYDIVTNARYGLGHMLTDANINRYALYRIAQYCDELVPDGKGGEEPRFTCNLYLQSQAEAFKVIQDMSSIFRGMAYWANGEILTINDMPADITFVYTPANVVDGKFEYQSSARKVRYTTALVSWSDTNDFGRAKVEYVADQSGVAKYGVQQTEVIAVGCSSQSMAQRLGRYILATGRYETNTITFSVGLEGTIVPPGAVIGVADPMRTTVRMGGRIASMNTTRTKVTVDSLPSIGVVAGDTLTVMMPDGVAASRVVLSVNTGTKEITVSSAFTTEAVAGAVWMVEKASLLAQKFRVVSVTENADSTFTIAALQYEPDKYDAADYATDIDPDPITIPGPIAGTPQPAPSSVSLTSSEVAGQVVAMTKLDIAWTAAPGAVGYDVQYQVDSGNWVKIGPLTSLNATVTNVTPGVYVARVAAINALGTYSSYTSSPTLIVGDQTTVPGVIGDIQDDLVEKAQAIVDLVAADAAEALARADADTALANDIADNAQAIIDEAAARTAEINTAVADSASVLQAQVDVVRAQVADIYGADEWDNATAYTEGELVQSGGKLYRALQDAPAGEAPSVSGSTAYWELLGNYTSLGDAVAGNLALSTQTASDLEAVSSTVDNNTARIGDAEADITSIISAYTSADSAMASDIEALQATVDDPTTGVAATADGLSALETRVTTNEGEIASQGTSIVSLNSSISNKDFLAGNGTNLLWGEYTRFTSATVPQNSRSVVTLACVTFAGSAGGYVLQGTTGGTSVGSDWAYLAASATNYNLPMSAGDYIVSFDAKASVAGHQIMFQLKGNNGTSYTIGAGNIALTATMTRYSGVVTLPSGVTAAELLIYFNRSGVSGRVVQLDRLMIEPKIGSGTTPSTWAPGPSNRLVDSNASATTALTTRVTAAEGVNTTQAGQITSLGTRMDDAESDITANTTATSNLDTRITAAEGAIEAISEDVTTLEGTVNDPATGVAANAAATSALDTRLTTAEGTITSQSDDITALENTVDDPSTGVAATASGLSTLTGRVTTAEGAIDALSANVVSLGTELDDKADSTAVDALTTRVTTNEGDIDTLSGSLVSLGAEVDDKASATAVDDLTARVTVNEGAIDAQATDISNLTATVGDVSASVTEFSQVAVSALANNACINGGFETGDFTGWGEGRDGAGAVPASATWGSSGAGTSHNGPGILSWQLSGTQQMFGNKGRLPVIPGQIVRLGCWQRSSVGDEVVVGDNLKVGVVGFDAAGVYIPGSETTIATYIYAGSAVLRELTGTYSVPAGVAYVGFYLDGTFTGTWLVDDCYLSLLSPLEQKVVASYGLALDADGKTVGMYGYNDGVTGKLVFDFDEVDFLSGTSGSSITGGIIKQTKGGYMYVTGPGFGASSDLTMWYGPAQAVSACTKANAIAYADTSGHFHIESLTTGDIEFYGSSDSTAVPNTLTLTVDDTDGGPKTLTATYSGERHFISTSSTPQSGTATLSLWRKIGSGSYVQLGSTRTVTFTDDVNDYDGSRYIHDFTGSLSTTFTDSNTTTGQTFTYQWRLTARSQTVSIQNMSLRSVE